MRRPLLCCYVWATLLASTSALIAEVLVLEPSKDNTLYEDPAGALSNGAGDHLFAGRVALIGGFRIRRAVLAFPVASAIKPGTAINSVSLRLRMSKTPTGARTVKLHRLLADWGEGASNVPGEEGNGVAAATGDATWRHTFFDTGTWATSGGDFVPIDSAGRTVGGVGFYTWESTPQLVADVQSWLDDPSTNFGWVLLGDESVPVTVKRFNSRHFPDPAERPMLTIIFIPDACDDNVVCNDGDVCTFDQCIDAVCSNTPNVYGDVDHDGDVDLFDLFCILSGFSGDFSVCSFQAADIEPCAGNATIDIFDLFAVLNAFTGDDPCCN